MPFGDALSVTAPFAGLGAGVGSAGETLDSAMKLMATAKSRMCFEDEITTYFLPQSSQATSVTCVAVAVACFPFSVVPLQFAFSAPAADGLSIDPKLACNPSSRPGSVV
jgi:hypothetical protein